MVTSFRHLSPNLLNSVIMNNICNRKRELDLVLSELNKPQLPTDVISIISGYCIDMECHESKVKANKEVRTLDLKHFFANRDKLYKTLINEYLIINNRFPNYYYLSNKLDKSVYCIDATPPMCWKDGRRSILSKTMTEHIGCGLRDFIIYGFNGKFYKLILRLYYRDTRQVYTRVYHCHASVKECRSLGPEHLLKLVSSTNVKIIYESVRTCPIT